MDFDRFGGCIGENREWLKRPPAIDPVVLAMQYVVLSSPIQMLLVPSPGRLPKNQPFLATKYTSNDHCKAYGSEPLPVYTQPNASLAISCRNPTVPDVAIPFKAVQRVRASC